MNVRLKRYKKDFEVSYAFGVFPTLELLTHRLDLASSVVAHPGGEPNAGVAKIRQICQKNDIPFEFQERALERLGARQNDYAVGVFRKIEPGLDAAADHIILVNPSSMGNLGTILRTMLGFGYRDLAIIQPAADIFNPEVVRASMGAIFQMRFASLPSFEAYQRRHPRPLYLLMTDGAQPLPATEFASPCGLVFGNESSGLSPEFKLAGQNVSIPQTAAVDSLNLAVAVGVTLYEASRKRLQKASSPAD
jgi:TrmH family RNA methyltransferase